VDLWIENILKPAKLLLAWEAPKICVDRRRWVVGEIVSEQERTIFRYFQGKGFSESNCGRSLSDLMAAGYRGYPAFQPYDSPKNFHEKVLEAFNRRLPPSDRSDFGRYLQHFRLRPGTELTTMSLLALTGAKLPGDGFEIVDPLVDTDGPFELVMPIAGFRHYKSHVHDLAEGDDLALLAEPSNSYDENAVMIQARGKIIGHVNRLQAGGFRRLLGTAEVSAKLLRLNGTPDVPKAFAFVSVRPRSVQKAA
jgi:hypothetical protein